MHAHYCSAVLFVKEMAASRRFYEELLGRQVEMDFGVNVGYVGGLALWEHAAALDVMFHRKPEGEARLGRENLELYFEIDDLDAALQAFTAAGVSLVHPIIEQPWGQRALRVYDPDGHIVEVAERMPVVVHRLAASGMDAEAIRARTGMPLPVVEQMLAEIAG
jgi:catechol 2,3-dioxygenase-like lactoylglutathione lyase family enzyme